MWGLWVRTRGGMGGPGHPPEAGGVLDWHTPTMQGLDVLTETWSWLEERFPRDVKTKRKARSA